MRNWLLLTGSRWAVAGVLLAGTLAALVAGGDAAAAADLHRLETGDPVQTLFQALVAGLITGVTLVLSVNQLVLSQELGALADQRERLRGAVDYREDVDRYTGGGASPAEPAAFLRSLRPSCGAWSRASVGGAEPLSVISAPAGGRPERSVTPPCRTSRERMTRSRRGTRPRSRSERRP